MLIIRMWSVGEFWCSGKKIMGGGHEWEVVAHGGSTVFTLSFNAACVGQPFYGKLRLHNMLSIGN